MKSKTIEWFVILMIINDEPLKDVKIKETNNILTAPEWALKKNLKFIYFSFLLTQINLGVCMKIKFPLYIEGDLRA